MSELQLGFLAIGAVVVVAVLIYNKWQEARYRRQAEVSFKSPRHDVLMQTEGGAEANTQATPSAAAGERIEPVFHVPERPDEAADIRGSALSDALDFVVPIDAEEDVPGSAVLEAAAAALAGCPRSLRWEGFNAATAQWEVLRPEGGYSLLRAGLQLVDRRGAASADELTAFGAGVQQAAAAAGALATIPDFAPALASAAELDRFCSDVDIQIALHVVSEGAAFTGTKVRALAEAAGLALDDEDGKYRRLDDAGRVLYTLADFESVPFRTDSIMSLTIRGLTLELDVPRAPRGAFDLLRELARQLAQALDARIVDDNRQPLGAAAFDQIRTQLQAIYQTMEARGIAAGSATALRLFS
ncbi:MAG: cell division protein ZipA C-terminal FtsZ-binding domain-containing protein [Burkholderiales bacterium]